MSKHLTKADTDAILKILASWTETLTWEKLIERCARVRKIEPARQTLYRAKEVREAYSAAKERLKNPPMNQGPYDLEAAIARMGRLEAQVSSLEAENAKYKEKFVRWQYNAAMRGLREVDLENELPTVDRGKTPKAG